MKLEDGEYALEVEVELFEHGPLPPLIGAAPSFQENCLLKAAF